MKKRKIKKEFKLTNREFLYMIESNRNIFNRIRLNLHFVFITSLLCYPIYFYEGKRVSREYYRKKMKEIGYDYLTL